MKSTTRFANRVEDYVKFRPTYPNEVVTFLEDKFGLVKGSIVADVGSGTGISSTLFLQGGYKVLGIEPNREMRSKSVELLKNDPNFIAVEGSAEETNLPANSVDIIVAGQAFHWFDRNAAKSEFSRILGSLGLVVLIWNERLVASNFERAYDELILKHARDYVQLDHRNIDLVSIKDFFYPVAVTLQVFSNAQVLDFEGLEGRLLSSSYMPAKGEQGYQDLSDDLKILFERYQENGLIRINYETKVYVGQLS